MFHFWSVQSITITQKNSNQLRLTITPCLVVNQFWKGRKQVFYVHTHVTQLQFVCFFEF